MQSLNRWEILDAASLADESSWTEQVVGFVNNFVQKDRRERWLYLLLQKPDKIRDDSHKLHGHLERAKCSVIEDESPLNPKAKGIYYDFTNTPVTLTVAEAFAVGPYNDGIFLIVASELAIYFFHEGENLLFKKPK